MQYYGVIRNTNYLKHHGILGMKWGIRRFQNKDGTRTRLGKVRRGDESAAAGRVGELDRLSKKGIRPSYLKEAHTIPAGTVIYRTTGSAADDPSGEKYVTYTDTDRQFYNNGFFINGSKVYEHVYELTSDINVPSRKESYDVIDSVLRKDPKLTSATIKLWTNNCIDPWRRYYESSDDEGGYDEQKWNRFVENTLSAFKSADATTRAFQAAQTLGVNPKLRARVSSILRTRGYNGMTDEAGVGGQNGYAKEGIDPLILFDGNVLKERASRQLSQKDILKARRNYARYRSSWSFGNQTDW